MCKTEIKEVKLIISRNTNQNRYRKSSRVVLVDDELFRLNELLNIIEKNINGDLTCLK